MNRTCDLYAGARRLKKVEPSLIRTVLDRAAALREAGKPVISLSAGEPDFDTPDDIRAATMRALESGLTKYTSNRGYAPLRHALSAYIESETGTAYDPESEILVTCGAAEALNNVMLAFVDEGDEVIVPRPSFVTYRRLVDLCGGKAVDLPLDPARGWQPDLAALRAAVGEKTKMIVVNNPANPTGTVFNEAVLAEICRLAVERNVLVLSDEIYSRLVYDGAVFRSVASFPGMQERSVIVGGFSKTFAMTGWRLGYLAADRRLTERILRVHQYCTTCAPTFLQAGVAEGMRTERTRKQVMEMADAFARRRALVTERLDAIPRLSYARPYGAFYLMLDVSGLGIDGMEFSQRLLEEKYVATVPAVGLGEPTGSYVRLSYAASEADIEEGLRRIAEFADEVSGKKERPCGRRKP